MKSCSRNGSLVFKAVGTASESECLLVGRLVGLTKSLGDCFSCLFVGSLNQPVGSIFATSLSRNYTSYDQVIYSHNSLLSFPPISPESVPLQVGLGKRNYLHHRYQMPFAGLLTYILPPFFFLLVCDLAALNNKMYHVPGPTLETMMHTTGSGLGAFL
ncbi:unnamed protein product [Protopolystoma xenopodis]|uniref:Uncharacterized protein n=1 Tax=Protopolystoma xenopodis TaxID=117903 RepID=A0A3S5FG85_9PLAT|nr:unnamed protein product [Protopolystoma xenopodis]